MLNSYTTWKLDSEYGDNKFDLPHTGIPVARSKWSVSIPEKEPLGIEVVRKPAYFLGKTLEACGLRNKNLERKRKRVAPGTERPTWTHKRQATSSL